MVFEKLIQAGSTGVTTPSPAYGFTTVVHTPVGFALFRSVARKPIIVSRIHAGGGFPQSGDLVPPLIWPHGRLPQPVN